MQHLNGAFTFQVIFLLLNVWNGARQNFISELQSLKDSLARHMPSSQPPFIYATGRYSRECDTSVICTVANYNVHVQIITFLHRARSRAVSGDRRRISKSHLIQ